MDDVATDIVKTTLEEMWRKRRDLLFVLFSRETLSKYGYFSANFCPVYDI